MIRKSHGITCLCSWKSNYRRAVNRPRRQAVNRQSQRAPHPPEVLQFSTLRRNPALRRVLRLLQLLLPRRNRANSKNKAFHVSSASFFLVSCRNLTSRMSVWPDFFGWSRFTFPLIFFSLKKFSVLTLSPQSQRTCVCVFLSRGPLPKVYSLRCLRFFFLKFFENLAIHTSIQSNTN